MPKRTRSERAAGQVLTLRRQGRGLLRIRREPKIGTGTVWRILAERGWTRLRSSNVDSPRDAWKAQNGHEPALANDRLPTPRPSA